MSPAAERSDELRVVAFVAALERRGDGRPLGEWLALVMDWPVDRAFQAIDACDRRGWLARSTPAQGSPPPVRATPAGQDAIPPVTLLENMALMGRDRDGMLPARRPPVPFSESQPPPPSRRRETKGGAR